MLRFLTLAENLLGMSRSELRNATDAGRREVPCTAEKDLRLSALFLAECKTSSQDNLQQHRSRKLFFGGRGGKNR